MNDHHYTNLRNYLEEIASTTQKVLAEQQRTNELLAGKQEPSTSDAHIDAVTQKVDTKKPAKGKGGKPNKPGNVTPAVNWNS